MRQSQNWTFALASTLLLCLVQPVLAQQDQEAADSKPVVGSEEEVSADYAAPHQFGGPSSVAGQLKSDHSAQVTPYWFGGLTAKAQPYYDFKKGVADRHAFAFGADYNALVQGANESLGEDDAASGVIRVYGTWTPLGRGTLNAGSLTFKVENRHRLGTDIAPQQLGSEMGYVGLTAITFSSAGTILTNLYWQQSFRDNRLAFIAGIVDVTDFISVYGLVNPWADFHNLTFSTDPTIPAPNQGLGAAVRGTIGENFYLLAGLADANGDPGDPLDSFDSFFTTHEYFKFVEFGWVSSYENRFSDNVHLTVWQADERTVAGVPDGWGASFSFSRKINDRWLPFVRAGYAEDGGALLERSLSAGIGYFTKGHSDVLGVGLNWGRPPSEPDGPRLNDQYTVEVFYNMQLFQHTNITPNIQWIIDPALNPEEDSLWVFGLRARVSF